MADSDAAYGDDDLVITGIEHFNREDLTDPGCCSCVVCCFACLSCCGCGDMIARKMVFFPPPPQYAIRLEVRQDPRVDDDVETKQVMYVRNERGALVDPIALGGAVTIHRVPTRRGQSVCMLFVRNQDAEITLLMSHGNATDIGVLRDHVIDMSNACRVNICAYDYTGYGLSSKPSRPSVADCKRDIEKVFTYITDPANRAFSPAVRPEAIVLYGQSIGSGPALHLARRAKSIAGVVIHSGIMSAFRVLKPLCRKTYWFDLFPNVDVVQECEAPVFVIHGVQDYEVPVVHGRVLHKCAPQKVTPWWVGGAGHNDIETDFREEYFARLKAFLEGLKADVKAVDTETPGAVGGVVSREPRGAGDGYEGADEVGDESRRPLIVIGRDPDKNQRAARDWADLETDR